MNFDAFISDITGNNWNVFGTEVYVNGALIENWGDTNTNRHPIYSATKTITSLATGMAIDDGKFDIYRPVINYLPSDVVSAMSPEQRDTYRNITVERLLTMSVQGYPFRPSGNSWLRNSLEIPLPNAAKREFSYSNISAYLVGVAAANAIDEDLYSYLSRRLFTPLGIENPPCSYCPDGYFYGASHMELTVNELSRIGKLLMHGGRYNGCRIISEAYIKEATSIKQPNCEGGYGYFIWKYNSGFSINGKWKQKCYILPESGIMVTFLSHIEEKCDSLIRSMEKHILGME